MNETTQPTTDRHFLGKPINYHPALDGEFDAWASDCGWDPESLRRASETAIRSRHHEAIIEHESHKACGNQPNIFTLFLGSLGVVYTVEPVG